MINKRLNERYKLLEVIGEGGMAIVYRAEDLILDRTVAVKVLRSEFSNDDEFILRFRREAESATSLSHPNIVNIYDVGEEEDQLYYIVMEYVEGMTLKEYIREKAPLQIEEALSIFDKICSAIRHAHENQIIHRDIKPHNILITETGQVKVTDFGIAMAMTSATITHTKSVLGSVHYLSPEQAKGSIATEKSDIYSLGVVLYEMVTGTVPFSGESPVTVALKHLQETFTSPRLLNEQIPQSLENIINKAMAKSPEERYDTVAQMQSDISLALEPTIEHQMFTNDYDNDETTKVLSPVTPAAPLQAEQQEKNEPPNKKKKKRRRLLLLIALLIFGFGAIATVAIATLFNAKEVEVPDVTGMSYEEAVKELEDKNLIPVKEEEYSLEIDEDHVIRQSPAPHSIVKERSEVKIVVSLGKETSEMENYVGKSKDNVERLISNLKFKDVEWIEVKSDEPSGTILSQSPEAGEEVVIEETTLILKYSSGIQTVSLDNLIGMTKKAAESYLKNKGLKVKITEEYSDKVEKNHVISQHPAPYEEVKKGSTVTLTISKGEDPSQKEQPITFEVSQPIELHEESEVIIRYQDATTKNGVAVNERASSTKTYKFSLTIAPNKTASYQIYINGKQYKNKTYTYDEVKNLE